MNINNKNLSLETFRREVEAPFHPVTHPYTAAKSRVNIYRAIFFGLGVLYFLFAIIVYQKSFTWTFHALFGGHLAMKLFLCFFCGGAGLSSLILGLLLSADKEALKQIEKKGLKKLRDQYLRESSKLGSTRLLPTSATYHANLLLKHDYQEKSEKLKEKSEDTYHLLSRITTSASIDSVVKEKLLNEALCEFRDQMSAIFMSPQSNLSTEQSG